MTSPAAMQSAVAAIIQQELGDLQPVTPSPGRYTAPAYTALRAALLQTEEQLRLLVKGSETEVHEWMAVIHYALAEERARLLG